MIIAQFLHMFYQGNIYVYYINFLLFYSSPSSSPMANSLSSCSKDSPALTSPKNLLKFPRVSNSRFYAKKTPPSGRFKNKCTPPTSKRYFKEIVCALK